MSLENILKPLEFIPLAGVVLSNVNRYYGRPSFLSDLKSNSRDRDLGALWLAYQSIASALPVAILVSYIQSQ